MDEPVVEVLAHKTSPFSRPLALDLQHRWSEPVRGLAWRLTFPDTIRRGDRACATLSFRANPGELPLGTVLIDGRRPDRLLQLRLKNRDTGATVEIRPDDPTGGMPDVPPPDGKLWGYDPDWIPIADGESREWKAWFPTSTAWESLAPGAWDAQVVMQADKEGQAPGAWSGSLSTPTVPLAIVEAPAVVVSCRVPRSLSRWSWPSASYCPQIGCYPEERETIAIEVRNGFYLGAWYREGENIRATCIGGPGGVKDWTLLRSHGVDTELGLPLDREVTIEIFETAEPPAHLVNPGPGRGFFRVLWKKSFRVTATAAEIEAL